MNDRREAEARMFLASKASGLLKVDRDWIAKGGSVTMFTPEAIKAMIAFSDSERAEAKFIFAQEAWRFVLGIVPRDVPPTVMEHYQTLQAFFDPPSDIDLIAADARSAPQPASDEVTE